MRKKTFLEKAAAVPHTVWIVMFIAAPLLFVIYYAFTNDSGAFTLSNVTSLPRYGEVFVRSVLFAFAATAVCFIIGYPLAYFMSRLKPSTQRILLLMLMLPMWVSLLIRTYSLMALLDNGGLFNKFLNLFNLPSVQILGTPGAVILGMVYDFLPYMVLPIYTSLAKLDVRYFEAAEDLGCSRIATIFKVALPLSKGGIISGITMVFVPSISTFYISQKLGNNNLILIGDTIEEQMIGYGGSKYVGAAISLVMMILIIISVAVMNRFGDDDGGEMIV